MCKLNMNNSIFEQAFQKFIEKVSITSGVNQDELVKIWNDLYQNKLSCNQCLKILDLDEFKIKNNKKYYKTCKNCIKKIHCEHGRIRSQCKDCGGGSICEHGRRRSHCKECKGGSICKHGRLRSHCKECGGSQICEHGRIKSQCKDCGGASICEHGKVRTMCKDCEGEGICEHNRIKYTCGICNPRGHLANNVRSRIYQALKAKKTKSSIEYLGCSIKELKDHLESQFQPGMSWENYGPEWHIDHIIPLQYENPTLEEVIERLYWTNTQPMWGPENIAKGNRWIG